MTLATRAHNLAVNGIRLRMIEYGAGAPIAFIHGLGWDHRLWTAAPGLFGGRYRVVLGDTRGHGESEHPPGPYSIAGFAADWRAALAALGIARCAIVGLSQGGMVAQQIAVDAPETVAALVLAGTSAHQDTTTTANMADRLAKLRQAGPVAAAQVAAEAIFSARFRAAEPVYLERFIAARAAQPQAPLIAAMAAGAGYDVRQRLAALRLPALVIAGGEDKLMPVATVREIVERIPGAEFALLPGAGHIIPAEQPEAFYRLVGDFLDRHYAPAMRAA